jgi:hypothetical protein
VSDETVLQDDPYRRVVRIGNTVRRPVHAWSPTIHQLLRHLESVGFPHSPRLLDVDAQGREILTYLDGESGPDGWAKVVVPAGLAAMARLLRDYHDVVASFRPPDPLPWAAYEAPVGDDEIVCHGDFGPWNLVWHGTCPIGILDWDYAWPARPIHDVAYALEYVAPFRDDDESQRWMRHPVAPDRRSRVETFASAYGLTSTDGLYDHVLAQQEQVLRRCVVLAAQGHQPHVEWEKQGQFDVVRRRVDWTRDNRALFD